MGPLTNRNVRIQTIRKSTRKVEKGSCLGTPGHQVGLDDEPHDGALVDDSDQAEERRPVLLPPELHQRVVDELPQDAEHDRRDEHAKSDFVQRSQRCTIGVRQIGQKISCAIEPMIASTKIRV